MQFLNEFHLIDRKSLRLFVEKKDVINAQNLPNRIECVSRENLSIPMFYSSQFLHTLHGLVYTILIVMNISVGFW